MLKTVLLSALLLAASVAASAQVREYRILGGGDDIGHLKADVTGGRVVIDYDVKDNGRGPTLAETIELDSSGIPVRWDIDGTTEFGNKIAERFVRQGSAATWRDATGEGRADTVGGRFYISHNGSPYALALLARTLLANEDGRLDLLPGGSASIAKRRTMTFEGPNGPVAATTYEISGLDMNPSYIVLDPAGDMFAIARPGGTVIRAGYEAADKRLRDYSEQLSTERFVRLQAETARNFEGPVRIRNVHLFDPKDMRRKGPYAVVWHGDRISSVQPNDSPAIQGETLIDGAGGTLVPGMYEMHAHMAEDKALPYLAAGVTSVRDMGNNNDVLDGLIERIENGTIAGPRIIRSGGIEGKSPFSNRNFGKLVETKEQALEAVRWYAARGYHQVKLYNSMNPAWAPELAEEAHRLGLRVTGHVPAFSNADAMIEAGFDELTHINQVMLGWVLEKDEDTRTLLRLTALDRLPAVDLESAPVQRTLDLIAQNKVAIDPTIVIHEGLLLGRNGMVKPSFADIYEHMPLKQQRNMKSAWADVSAPGQDEKYRGAFDQIVRTISKMRERGIRLLPGTDVAPLAYHRELELFELAGFTAPEVLRIATLGMAEYLGQDENLGSIEGGKYADFFLVPGDPTKDLKALKAISMVVADGTVYFPADIHPHFGIRPFADPPQLVETAQ